MNHLNQYVMCRTCADIVLDGYSDNVDTLQLQRLTNYIDNKILLKGHYWTELHDEVTDNYTCCCACGEYHDTMHQVYSAKDDEFLGIG